MVDIVAVVGMVEAGDMAIRQDSHPGGNCQTFDKQGQPYCND